METTKTIDTLEEELVHEWLDGHNDAIRGIELIHYTRALEQPLLGLINSVKELEFFKRGLKELQLYNPPDTFELVRKGTIGAGNLHYAVEAKREGWPNVYLEVVYDPTVGIEESAEIVFYDNVGEPEKPRSTFREAYAVGFLRYI